MVRLTLGTNTNRKTVMVEVTETLEDILEENNVSTTGASVHLNGMIVLPDEMDCTLEELDVEDETDASLITVVKADSAR